MTTKTINLIPTAELTAKVRNVLEKMSFFISRYYKFNGATCLLNVNQISFDIEFYLYNDFFTFGITPKAVFEDIQNLFNLNIFYSEVKDYRIKIEFTIDSCLKIDTLYSKLNS